MADMEFEKGPTTGTDKDKKIGNPVVEMVDEENPQSRETEQSKKKPNILFDADDPLGLNHINKLDKGNE